MLALVDGQPVNEVTLSIHDLGFLRGYGVFDYLRTYQGRPFHLQAHLERFAYSAKEVGLTLPYSLDQIHIWIEELLQRASAPESSVKIILTAGESPDHFFPKGPCRLIILVYPFTPPSPHLYEQGISAITLDTPRPLPKVKSLYYMPGVHALAKNRQAGEVLYLGEKKEILDGSTSNFFAFMDGRLHTAHADSLIFGITREVVLRLSEGLFPCTGESVHYSDMPRIEEAFITSSSREILPVISIDGVTLGNGTIGARTQQLMRLFFSYKHLSLWPSLSIERHIG